MQVNSLAVVIAYAGEYQYLEETMTSVFASQGVHEIVVGVDLSKTTMDESRAAWTEWEDFGNSAGVPLRLVFSEKKGPAAVRNLAIAASKSTIILPVDSDDRIHSKYAKLILESYSRNDSSLGIVYGKAELFGDAIGEWKLPKFSIEGIVLENCIYATAAFRREDWVSVGGYDEELIYGQEDWDFWLKIIGLGKKVIYLDELVFFYRIRANSRSVAFRNMWEQVIWTYDRVCNNNKDLMASQIFSIYHRRIELELENSTLARASKGLIVAFLRKYPRFRRVVSMKATQNFRRKLENGKQK